MKETVKEIDPTTDNTSVMIDKYDADSTYKNFDTAFPISAGLGCYLYVSIDFHDGSISEPTEGTNDNLSSSTFSELYKNSITIQLGRLVTKQIYTNLLNNIAPLVSQVVRGYRYNGPNTMALLSSDAENALEQLSMFNVQDEDEDENIRIWDGEDIYEYYANDSEFVKKENGEIAFMHLAEELLMSNSSDDALKFTAQTEIENLDAEINLHDLISYLQDLRELCIENKDAHCDNL